MGGGLLQAGRELRRGTSYAKHQCHRLRFHPRVPSSLQERPCESVICVSPTPPCFLASWKFSLLLKPFLPVSLPVSSDFLSFSAPLPHRLFGQDGLCAACDKRIRAYEMTMRVKDKVYHLECFKCAACQKHFCVGDRYLLINSDIVCEQDIYEWTKINGMI